MRWLTRVREALVWCCTECRAPAINDVGWLFATFHAVALTLCVANMSPPDREFADMLDRVYAEGGWSSATVYAGRPFHLTYESLPLQLITLVDIPAMLLAVGPSYCLEALNLVPSSAYYQSYYVFGGELLFGSMQWLFVGVAFAKWTRPGTWRERIIRTFRARRTIIFVALVITLLVGAPLLQWRSNQLGFRHPGISFGPADSFLTTR